MISILYWDLSCKGQSVDERRLATYWELLKFCDLHIEICSTILLLHLFDNFRNKKLSFFFFKILYWEFKKMNQSVVIQCTKIMLILTKA